MRYFVARGCCWDSDEIYYRPDVLCALPRDRSVPQEAGERKACGEKREVGSVTV